MLLFRATFAPLLDTPLSPDDERGLARELARLRNLAPGDFAAVTPRVRVLDRRQRAPELLAELRAECAAKEGAADLAGFRV